MQESSLIKPVPTEDRGNTWQIDPVNACATMNQHLHCEWKEMRHEGGKKEVCDAS